MSKIRPWRIIEWTRRVRDHIEISFDVVDEEHGTPVVRVGKNESHALLIAAAPEMLDCLEMVEYSNVEFNNERFAAAVKQVLAKVRGDL